MESGKSGTDIKVSKGDRSLRIAAKLMRPCVRMLLWLAAALVALAAGEVIIGSLAEVARIPYEQALILVACTPLLILGLYLERGGRSRYDRRR